MKRSNFIFWILAGVLLTQSCKVVYKPYYSRGAANWPSVVPPDSAQLKYSVFLIGDVGAPSLDPQEPSLRLLEKHLQQAGEQSAVVFLGDNIYHYGMPEPGALDRELSERRMNEQLNILANYPGEKYMIPGNHDWSNGGRGGLAAALRQEQYVERYLEDTTIVVGGNFFVPDDGCPGPYEVLLQDDLLLIALNSQWWLHPHERPYGPNNYCNITNEADLLVQLEDIIRKNQDRNILVVAHHPLSTQGNHGGYYQLLDHIFPLTLLIDWLYVPLPVIGSIYPLGRMLGGVSQDTPHPKYQAYISGLMSIFEKYDNVVYAAGHEHSLQYFNVNGVQQIVSGSGCKRQHMRRKGEAIFAHEAYGYAVLNFYANEEVWVEFWEPGPGGTGDGSEGVLAFRAPMYTRKKRPQPDLPPAGPQVDFRDSTVTVAANPGYEVNAAQRLLIGQHYRPVWNTPVKMDLLDLQREQGGLIPYKRVGGQTTAALRLRSPEGREFTLRTLNKDPAEEVPEGVRQVVASDLLQGRMSAHHPYASLALPRLSAAAGVFHVNPKLVYVPEDPRLGYYLPEFSNTVAILQENPDDDHQDVESLGYARNLVGSDRMFERLRQDNDHSVDSKKFARARLFDMLIGDWDRHEGQWRWVERRSEGRRLFEPVPKNRDMAFYKADDGLIPFLASRRWALRNIQSFRHNFGDIVGLNLTALPLDRTLLSELTKADWAAVAQDVQAALTDEVIEAAIRDLPAEVFAVSGPDIISKLKSRRDLLPQAAADFYGHLARVVDVAGSNSREYFEIIRLNNRETAITVRNIRPDSTLGRVLYRRTLHTAETEEVRIYGLGGDDVFEVSGEVGTGILIRIIGGEGHDRITDQSRVGGMANRTYVYDTKEGNTFTFGPSTRDKTADYPEINNYDRQDHGVPYLGPRIYTEYNVDDALRLGAGLTLRTPGFRRSPFAQQHYFRVNYAFGTAAHSLTYDGTFTQAIGRWDLNLGLFQEGPQFLFNYFGLGNETRMEAENIRFNRVNFSQFRLSPAVSRNLTSFFKIGVGPQYSEFWVEQTPDRFVATPEAGVDPGSFGTTQYLGLRFFANVEAMNNLVNPRLGIKFLNEAVYHHQMGANGWNFTNLNSEFLFYLTPNLPFRATLAFRLGGAHNIGDFRFFQANTLGGTENLRGYRRNQYAGRSSLYQNTELRIKLLRYDTYLLPLNVGILGLVDHGRVFADGEHSRKIHRGIGGGVWVDFLNQTLLNATYTAGEFERVFNVTFGFLF
jgi:hypothetical protein